MEYSIAKIKIPEFKECGTCYFLTKDIVVTCFHVIARVFLKQTDAEENKWHGCEVVFNPNSEIKVKCFAEALLVSNEENDIAILRLSQEIDDAKPVKIQEHNTCPPASIWKCQGYPALASEESIQVKGEIVTFDGVVKDRPRIKLTVPDLFEKQLGGFSGSPVFVDRNVIGHLTSVTADAKGDMVFQSLHAISSSYTFKLASPFVDGFNRYLGIVDMGENEIYIKRGCESIISEKLLKSGQGVMLSGYLKSGKSHTIKFFENYKDVFAEFETDVSRIIIASLSLQVDVLPWVQSKDLNSVAKRFCATIKSKLEAFGFKEDIEFEYGVDPNAIPWNSDLPLAFNVNNWFSKVFKFLEETGKCFMLFVDDAGDLFEKLSVEENEEFFTILRGLLVEKRSYFGLLISFTSTSVLKNPVPAPLLNMYYPVSIEDFTEEDIAAFGNNFCRKYDIRPKDLPLTPEQLIKIKNEIAGNPWLLSLFLDKLRQVRDSINNFVSDRVFENKLSDQTVYFVYLNNLQGIIPQELKEEISLYRGSIWKKSPIDGSVAERRHKLVNIGILQEKFEENSPPQYKLRCRQFENISRQ